MLTIRTDRAGDRTEQRVCGTVDTDAELALWAEAVGATQAVRCASAPVDGNGVRGGVVVTIGSFVSWWVTV